MPRRAARKPRRKGARKSRIPRAPKNSGTMSGVKNTARIVEGVLLSTLQSNSDTNYFFNIGEFDRAMRVAACFKFYRAKRVTWKYIPLYNQFTAGATVTRPTYQWIMNRNGDSNTWTSAEYDAQGAIGRAVNQTTISYVPNLLQAVSVRADKAVTVAQVTPPDPIVASSNLRDIGTRPLYGAWLTTPPMGQISTVAGGTNSNLNRYADSLGECYYHGHSMLLSNGGGPAIDMFRVYVEVVWEFKDPNFLPYVAPPALDVSGNTVDA